MCCVVISTLLRFCYGVVIVGLPVIAGDDREGTTMTNMTYERDYWTFEGIHMLKLPDGRTVQSREFEIRLKLPCELMDDDTEYENESWYKASHASLFQSRLGQWFVGNYLSTEAGAELCGTAINQAMRAIGAKPDEALLEEAVEGVISAGSTSAFHGDTDFLYTEDAVSEAWLDHFYNPIEGALQYRGRICPISCEFAEWIMKAQEEAAQAVADWPKAKSEQDFQDWKLSGAPAR